MISFAFVLAAALAGGDPVAPTVAQSAPAASTSATGAQKTAQNEQVCKSVMVTGTRFPSHECHTRAEWNEIAANARKATSDMTSLGGGMNGSGGNGK
jgi:hypothetical protein